MSPPAPALRIAIVGPCAAGKSTLARGLRAHGYDARQIVQEHSYVPQMWAVLTRPDLLVYLDASHAASLRRKDLRWSPREHAEQLRRLAHARQHCDVYLHTDDLTPQQVLAAVLKRLPPPAAH